jgi:hypothetical protein
MLLALQVPRRDLSNLDAGLSQTRRPLTTLAAGQVCGNAASLRAPGTPAPRSGSSPSGWPDARSSGPPFERPAAHGQDRATGRPRHSPRRLACESFDRPARCRLKRERPSTSRSYRRCSHSKECLRAPRGQRSRGRYCRNLRRSRSRPSRRIHPRRSFPRRRACPRCPRSCRQLARSRRPHRSSPRRRWYHPRQLRSIRHHHPDSAARP